MPKVHKRKSQHGRACDAMAVFAISTTRTMDETINGLRDAATRNHFTVLSILNLKEKLNAKGFAFVPELRIVELCNSEIAAKALSIELGVSVALPCRISVYEECTSSLSFVSIE